MRKKIYRIITFTLYYSRLLWVINYFLAQRRRGVILGYHRVSDKNDFLPDGLRISKKLFSKQLKLLSEHFLPQSLESLIANSDCNETSKVNVCITIDDGFSDIVENALPVLTKYNIPFTIFICTGMIEAKKLIPLHQLYYLLNNENQEDLIKNLTDDIVKQKILEDLVPQPEKFMRTLENFLGYQLNSKKGEIFVGSLGYGDFAQHLPDLIYLSWNDIKIIQSTGNSIGSHTHNHPRLGYLNKAEQEKEIKKSIAVFSENLGFHAKEFAYPFGDKASYNNYTIEVLKDLNFSLACTTEDGFYSKNDDEFKLKRKMNLNKPIDVFAFELLGFDCLLRDYYKKIKEKYNSIFDFMPIGQYMRYGYIFKHLHLIDADTILEIGASSPTYLKKISHEYINSEIIGVDVVKENIGLLNDIGFANIKYYLEDMQNPTNNITDKKFDLVICSDVLAHVEEDVKLLKNVFNIMNDNGILLIHTPTKTWNRIFKEFDDLNIDTFDMVRQGYNDGEIVAILKEIGFQPISIKYTSKIFGKLAWELEQKANKYRYLTRLIFPLLKFLVSFDHFVGRSGNGLMIEVKKVK